MRGPSKRRFEDIYQTGLRVRGEHVRILFLAGEGHLGVATSRGIGNRPRRNRVRRRAQEILRTISIPPGLDAVVQLSASASAVSYRDLEKALWAAFLKVEQRWADVSASS